MDKHNSDVQGGIQCKMNTPYYIGGWISIFILYVHTTPFFFKGGYSAK